MKNRQMVLEMLALVAAAAMVVSGCSSNSAASSCGKVEPCGGSIVGRWKVAAFCVNGTAIGSSVCPGASFDASKLKLTGTGTYDADLTYSMAATYSGSATTSFPMDCPPENGVTLTCAQYDATSKANLADHPDPSIESVSCVAVGTRCDCTTVFTSAEDVETGTYVTSGTTVTTTPSDGSAQATDSYCLQGTSLHFVSVDMTMNMGPMGQATITGDVVLSKQ